MYVNTKILLIILFIIFSINNFFFYQLFVNIYIFFIYILSIMFNFDYCFISFITLKKILSNTYLNDYIFFLEILTKLNYFGILLSVKFIYITSILFNIFLKPESIFFSLLLLCLVVFFSFFFISYLGLYGVYILNFLALFLLWAKLSTLFTTFFFNNNILICNFGRWFYISKNYSVNLEFCIDQISFSFFYLTTTIGLFVYIYTFSYFRYEPLVERLLLLICFFIISMSVLVISGNFILLLLGWELIGLSSFFLINFWITKKSTLKSAFKAFVFNKISDVFLFFVLILFLYSFNTLNIIEININAPNFINKFILILGFKFNLLNLCCIFLMLSAFIKSAQIFFHLWLPDSMEAPVPASSLIHSATLVSAGIFLILRFNSLIEYSNFSTLILPLVGSITAAYGGVVASTQSDIKRILAYSTISHCGFLIFLSGSFMNEYVILYLYIHGFFKAISFMCVGNILRFSGGYQDFRRMGGYYKYLPFEGIILFISLLNLGGLPFTIGFFAKHLLFITFTFNFWFKVIITFFLFVGAITGVIYSFRLYYFIFFDIKKGNKYIYKNINLRVSNIKNYTNSTKANMLSILLLLLTSYIVCFILLNKLLYNYTNISDFNNYILNLNWIYLKNFFIYLNLNIFIFNFIVIMIIFILVCIQWRYDFFYLNKNNNIIKTLLFILFFLLNYIYLL